MARYSWKLPVRPFVLASVFIVGQRLGMTDAHRARVETENTSALLGLYTQFLQCFVSADLAGPTKIIGSSIGSVESIMIPQNAGCTMAIHADCTTIKN
ncbi:hypothetical protein JFT81_10820 [Pseudomonas sp. TH43]|uniref:hypothetical protein n=1 Tax=Pseudomonas sp. TH43 TaxID=2796407 RepID=UPI001913F195|nr:hypothetical protein [Pseudomonas sp. TH43]MBK5375120.1 hypothetical protein [Pseudomonas sp. TH43]